MIPIRNEAIAADSEGLKKAEHLLSELMHEKGLLLKGNREVWKGLITLRTWLKKAISGDNSAALQIKCYGEKLLGETAKEVHTIARDESRMEEESPSFVEKSVRLKSVQYFEAYNELLALHEWLKKRELTGSELHSIPLAV